MTFFTNASDSSFNTPDATPNRPASHMPPTPAISNFGFEHLGAMDHEQRIMGMQAAAQEAQRKKDEAERVAKEDQEQIHLEMGLEAAFEQDGDVAGGAESKGSEGGELVLENPTTTQQQNATMTETKEPEMAGEETTMPAACFVEAPPPGVQASEDCATLIGYDKRTACEALDEIDLNSKSVFAVVTSYADGMIVLAIISPPKKVSGSEAVSAAELLFGEKETDAATSAGDDSEGKQAGFTECYYGRKKVNKLLEQLTLAEEPIAVMARSTAEQGTTVFLIGRQQCAITSTQDVELEDASIKLKAEMKVLQDLVRLPFQDAGGDLDLLNSELESICPESDNEEASATSEDGGALLPQSPRSTKPMSLSAMAAQEAAATSVSTKSKRGPKAGKGRGRGRGRGTGTGRGASNARVKKP